MNPTVEDDADRHYVPADSDSFLGASPWDPDEVPPGADDYDRGDRALLPTVEDHVDGTDPGSDQDEVPVLGAAARYGIAADVLEVMEPISEADPAAILVSFLAGAGNLIGPAPHVFAGHTKHPARIFPVIVGTSGKSRKGTSWNAVRPFLEAADSQWARQRIMDGFGSGEVLIDQVADPDPDDEPQEEQPRRTDKRLLVMAPEYAGILNRASRDGSVLSPVIREAFDSGRLETRSRSHGNTIATGAHVSIVGHITALELQRRLTETDAANGFANRFIYSVAHRSKRLPFSEPHPVDAVSEIGTRIQRARDHAIRNAGITFTDEARPLWADLYNAVADDEPGGLLGAVTARGDVHTLRLALIYALLDEANGITVNHLEAAAAVWSYCRHSARVIFGDAIGDALADKILTAVRRAGAAGITLGGIRDLAKNTPSPRRRQILEDLEAAGKVYHEEIPTGGRPEIRYYPTPANTSGRTL